MISGTTTGSSLGFRKPDAARGVVRPRGTVFSSVEDVIDSTAVVAYEDEDEVVPDVQPLEEMEMAAFGDGAEQDGVAVENRDLEAGPIASSSRLKLDDGRIRAPPLEPD